jgi:hypothetical protein
MMPEVLTILPTYTCTAACRECCFECSPKVRGRVPLNRILRYIDEAVESISTLRLLVFSGGECFLLGRDLNKAIAHAHQYGLKTRCVTNGYWAISSEAAQRRLGALKEAGLTELNISTGDDHQKYVPFDRVVNGALSAAELGIVILVVVEGFTNSTFKSRDVHYHPRVAAFMQSSPRAGYLHVIQNIWMPFHADRELTHTEETYRTHDRAPAGNGCDNVLHNIVVTPDESLASCCGLTMEHIPEMKLGKLLDHSIAEMVDRGMHDFLKRWIWLDGPEALLWFAHQKDPRVPVPQTNVHPCETCAQFYLNGLARDAIRKHWHEVRDDVLLRYELKLSLIQRQSGQPRPRLTDTTLQPVVRRGDS